VNREAFASELTKVRRRIEELYAGAPTPAVASYLRLMAEAAVVAEGYVSPEQAPLADRDHLGATSGEGSDVLPVLVGRVVEARRDVNVGTVDADVGARDVHALATRTGDTDACAPA